MFKKLLKMNVIMLLTNVGLSLTWGILRSSDPLISIKSRIPVLLLIESAFFFLFGGLRSFSDSIFINKVRKYIYKVEEKWSGSTSVENIKKNDVYVFEGILLLLESVLLGYLFG